MCRLLFIKNNEKFSIQDYLNKFALICKNSKEYQGHGWGLSYLENNEWRHYKNIHPIWEDDIDQFGQTKLLIAHARSAFRDKDIRIENNMPFYNDKYVFVFNGELKGVQINIDGRIGAEKIFNFINRFNNGDIKNAFQKGIEIINKRTKYIKAMNIILTDKNIVLVNSQFNEEAKYFTMSYKQENDNLIICSDPLDNTEWKQIPNNSITEFEL